GETGADQVRAMLGLADRGRVLDLFDLIMKGDAAGALTELSGQYAEGADPMAVLRDLAEITHWISVVKITPEAADDPTIGPDERARGQQMADALPMRVLTRLWQMLLKALDEVAEAPNAMMAAEMAIIRLTHVADLPSPEELVRKLRDMPAPTPPGPGSSGASHGAHAPDGSGQTTQAQSSQTTPAPTHRGPSGPSASGNAQALAVAEDHALAHYPTFEHVVELIRTQRDVKLLVEVESHVRLASYRPGRIEFQPTPDAPQDLSQRLAAALQRWTGSRWGITLVNEGGTDTIAHVRDAEENALRAEAQGHPMVQAVLSAFPKARITSIRTEDDIAANASAEALPEVEDEWDPFEED
ncbi:MAG: DNA polymerase III subunit gamma/tau, partial [Roseovarius gahaiensis]